MRKGDIKRQELLQTAERFFCAKGYEETSVQDIIDAASSSKGGFYHYFPSKEAVLDALCAARAESAAETVKYKLSQLENPVDRINAVLSGMMPLHSEAKLFLSMMLPVLSKPEGLPVLVRWQRETLNSFLPILEQEMANARRGQLIYPVTGRAAKAAAILANECWVEALQEILSAAEKTQRPEPAALMDILETYRKSIEVILDAPFGSIELAKLENWDALTAQLSEVYRKYKR